MKNKLIPISASVFLGNDPSSFSMQDLENLKALHDRYIFPVGVQQDPRIVPQGRIISAEVVSSGENEFFLQGEVEWFDTALQDLTNIDHKEIRTRKFGEPTILYDSHFDSQENQEIIYELSVLLKGRSEKERKNANPFLSVLSIAATFPFGGIYKAFHKQFDRSGLKTFRVSLHHLMKRKTKAEERIFSFIASMAYGNQIIQAEILLTNPEPRTINRFFNKSLKRFDSIFQKHFQVGKGIRKMVYAYEKDDFNFLFALRKDGIPLEPKRK